MQQVTIHEIDSQFYLYAESGQVVETEGFNSYKEAQEWAAENEYELVPVFNIN